MNKRILTVSSAYMCLSAEMQCLPGGSQEREGTDYQMAPGGSGMTAALTFRAMGFDSIYCAATGDDAYGRRIGNFLSKAGVDCRYMKSVKKAKTGLYLTLNEEDKSRRFVKFPGANAMLTREDIEEAFMTYPDALYIQKELSDELTVAAVSIAHEKNVPVFFQPCRKREELQPEALGKLEMVILDADEVYSYCGTAPNEYDKFLQAAMALSSRIKAKYYVIRIPDRGTFIYDGIYYEMTGEYPSTYLDESGAKEVYGAALTAAYTGSDFNIKKAAKCAAAAYAYASSNKGDLESVPSLSDLVPFLKK
ncbi:MAG: carbohydrate kinase family protein [Clostridia bacterium]|nr:carbohydrate kinase family protein [Clostridia bacterium]